MTTLPNSNLIVSFVISTYNRREVLLATLNRIRLCGLGRDAFEVLVVDNASHDGTADAVARRFPDVRLFRLNENLGSCAKNVAILHTLGRYVVFLDDDSFPQPHSVARMVWRFETSPRLGAAVFTVTLPDGSRECSAYPDVFIGCGTGFRRRALVEVGGLPRDFFMQAEEYDLSLRLLAAGWDVRTFDDLHVTHLKTPGARCSWRTMRLDVRNNLLVATRYFPDRWVGSFTLDWMARYYAIAASKRQRTAFFIGLLEGASRAIHPEHRRPVSDAVFERFVRLDQIEQSLRWHQDRLGLRSILLIDYGKNIFPFWLAAKKCALELVAIADNRLAGRSRYRGIPIVNDAVARRLDFDASVISNLSPVHAESRARIWRQLDDRPVIDLFEIPAAAEIGRTPAATAQTARRSGLAA